MDWITLAVAVLSSSLLGGVVAWIANRKKTDAEASVTTAQAETTVSDQAIRYTEGLVNRIKSLEEGRDTDRREHKLEMEAMRKEYTAIFEAFRKENLELHKEVASLKAELNLYKMGLVVPQKGAGGVA